MKPTKAQIDDFLAQEHIAIAGYSRNSKKFGNSVYQTLTDKGFNLYPVNPFGGETENGKPVYEHLDALPEVVKSLLVITKPDATKELVIKAREKGFTHIWIQQFSENKDVLDLLKDTPFAITNQCILMHTHPEGIHKFHWWLAKVFKSLPV